jgi:hypothetical protein
MPPKNLVRPVEPPVVRRLRIYAIDPIVSPQQDPVVTVEIPWEPLEVGPRGRLVEVIDYDASAKTFYSPVELDHPHVLAREGLDPSESDPRFHQQMVYAVVMATHQRFQRALGRFVPLYGPPPDDAPEAQEGYEDTPYLKPYHPEDQPLKFLPHGMLEPNAFYSAAERMIVCGYFRASSEDCGRNLPRGVVFTCLAHDIVAHEVTHGILHGLRPHFLRPTGMDVLAFHEAFADLIAILQRFRLPGFLERAIQDSHAKLDQADPLFEMGRQFGEAIGRRGAIRSAIRKEPDPSLLEKTHECHDRGAILLAAIFQALIAVYRKRTRSLCRLASNGTGMLPEGALPHDLVAHLAYEARKTAAHFLDICIRAIDYCPPVHITFGDYLRALITADRDLVPSDPWGYRVALIDSFRSWGIYPEGVVSLAEESLVWDPPSQKEAPETQWLREQLKLICLDSEPTTAQTEAEWERYGKTFHKFLTNIAEPKLFHLSDHHDVRIDSVRPLRRIGPDGRIVNELVVQAMQFSNGDGTTRNAKVESDDQQDAQSTIESDAQEADPRDGDSQDGLSIHPIGGSTLIINADGHVRYCVHKRITNANRLRQQREFTEDFAASSIGQKLLGTITPHQIRDFSILHRGW